MTGGPATKGAPEPVRLYSHAVPVPLRAQLLAVAGQSAWPLWMDRTSYII